MQATTFRHRQIFAVTDGAGRHIGHVAYSAVLCWFMAVRYRGRGFQELGGFDTLDEARAAILDA